MNFLIQPSKLGIILYIKNLDYIDYLYDYIIISKNNAQNCNFIIKNNTLLIVGINHIMIGFNIDIIKRAQFEFLQHDIISQVKY